MKYDVIVIGAGPGGCGAAVMLKKQGKSVLIHEKNAKGTLLPCGGIMAPDFYERYDFPVEELKALGVPLAKNIKIVDEEESVSEFNGAYGISREKTDEYFQNLATDNDIEIRFESKISNIEKNDKIFKINEDEADYVIVAAGAVAGIKFNGSLLPYTTSPVPAMSAVFKGIPAKEYFFYQDYAYGNNVDYAWITTLGGDLYNVGLGIGFKGNNKNYDIKAEFEKFVNEKISKYIGEDFEMISKPQGRVIGYGDNLDPQIENLFMIGDAANSAAITGEGIRHAVFDADQVANFIREKEDQKTELSYDKTLNWYLDNVYSKYVKTDLDFEPQKRSYKVFSDTYWSEVEVPICCEFQIVKGAKPDVSYAYKQSQFMYENPFRNTAYSYTGDALVKLSNELKALGLDKVTYVTELDTADNDRGGVSYYFCGNGIDKDLLKKMHFGIDGNLISDAIVRLENALAPYEFFLPCVGYMEGRDVKCIRLTLRITNMDLPSKIFEKVQSLVQFECPKEFLDSLDKLYESYDIHTNLDFDLLEDGSIGSTFGFEIDDGPYRLNDGEPLVNIHASAQMHDMYDAAVNSGVADETIYRLVDMRREKTFFSDDYKQIIDFTANLGYFKLVFKKGKLTPIKAYFKETVDKNFR